MLRRPTIQFTSFFTSAPFVKLFPGGASTVSLRKAVVVVLIVGLLVGGSYASFLSSKGGPRQATSKYRVAPVDLGSVATYVTATGTLNPVTLVNVGTQLSGTVSKLFADFNDPVKTGEPLLELDPAIYRAQVKQAEANLEVSKAALDLAKSNLSRNEALVAKNFLSPAALEQTRKEAVSALAQFEAAKAQLDRARTDLSNTIIRAPIDGIVIKRSVDIGQTVAATFQTPTLFQIARDLREMQIDTNLSEADIADIRAGMEVGFAVDAYQGKYFAGKVRQLRLNATNQQGAVTYNLVIDVSNDQRLLTPGMTAQVQIVTKQKSSVLRIQSAAMRFRPTDSKDIVDEAEDGKSGAVAKAINVTPVSNPEDDGTILKRTDRAIRSYRVFTLTSDSHLKPVEVQIGLSNTRFSEVVGGPLKAGDRVVIQELSSEVK